MEHFRQETALRIFTDETALGNQRRLFEEIIEKARAAQLAGATVITGVLGFGRSRVPHTDKMLRLSFDPAAGHRDCRCQRQDSGVPSRACCLSELSCSRRDMGSHGLPAAA